MVGLSQTRNPMSVAVKLASDMGHPVQRVAVGPVPGAVDAVGGPSRRDGVPGSARGYLENIAGPLIGD